MKKFLFAFFCSFFPFSLFASDAATFHNLGFSNDSRYFLFAENGQNLEKGEIYVNGYLVDTVNNRFVKNGIKKSVFPGAVQAGYSDTGAVLNLISQWNSFLNPYSINHLNTGRLVYSLEPGNEPKSRLNYRDFFTKKNYEIELNQFKTENPLSSSFFISLKVTDSNGKVSSQMVGIPDLKRTDVDSYFIRQIVISPDNRYLVFVIAKTIITDGETSIRYMVETTSL